MPFRPAHLFQSNPPSEAGALRETFCNRAAELRRLLRQISPDAGRLPIGAIHGEARTGKSHLMLRALLELPDADWRKIQVSVNNVRNPWVPLRDIAARIAQDVSDAPELDVLHRLVDDVDAGLAGWSREDQRGLAISGGQTLKLGVAPAAVDAAASATGTVSTRDAKSFSAPTFARLVDATLAAMRAVRARDPRRFLIAVDDLDMLDADEGGEHSHALTDQLVRLAASEDVLVIATVRTRTFNGRDKDFFNLVTVDPLSPAHLREVYEAHLRAFNDGEAVLTPEALEDIIRHTRGKVGMLLERCREVQEYAERHDRLPVDPDALRAWAGHWLQVSEQGPLLRPISLIRAAVADRRAEVRTPSFDPKPTALMYRVLHEGREADTWEIDQLFLDVLRGRDA